MAVEVGVVFLCVGDWGEELVQWVGFLMAASEKL